MKFLTAAMLVGVLVGCASAPQPETSTAGQLTVGTVQRSIRLGMSGGEVAAVLGSPNIVSTDEERREVWIYDKVSTQVSYSSEGGWVFLGIVGGQNSKKSSSTSQQTLTIIIKFDGDGKVRDVAYHAARF